MNTGLKHKISEIMNKTGEFNIPDTLEHKTLELKDRVIENTYRKAQRKRKEKNRVRSMQDVLRSSSIHIHGIPEMSDCVGQK